MLATGTTGTAVEAFRATFASVEGPKSRSGSILGRKRDWRGSMVLLIHYLNVPVLPLASVPKTDWGHQGPGGALPPLHSFLPLVQISFVHLQPLQLRISYSNLPIVWPKQVFSVRFGQENRSRSRFHRTNEVRTEPRNTYFYHVRFCSVRRECHNDAIPCTPLRQNPPFSLVPRRSGQKNLLRDRFPCTLQQRTNPEQQMRPVTGPHIPFPCNATA